MSKMHTATCTHPGCGKKFSSPKPWTLNGSMTLHMKKHQREANPEAARNSEAPKEKRPYTKRQKASVGVNFCPGCGCNLRAVSVAMGM